MQKIILIFAFLMTVVAGAHAADGRETYEGFYWSEDKSAIIELRLHGESIEGKTVWGPPAGARDTKNPDEKLQKRPIIGLIFLSGFEYDAKKQRWKNGKVYDPNNGKTYDAKMKLTQGGSVLEMRGYVGISLLGRTARFERVQTTNIPAGLLNAVKHALTTD